jgi:hypothetical protein
VRESEEVEVVASKGKRVRRERSRQWVFFLQKLHKGRVHESGGVGGPGEVKVRIIIDLHHPSASRPGLAAESITNLQVGNESAVRGQGLSQLIHVRGVGQVVVSACTTATYTTETARATTASHHR